MSDKRAIQAGKKVYVPAEITVIHLAIDDVITSSDQGEEQDLEEQDL